MRGSPVLAFEHVHKRFEHGVPVLSGSSFVVDEGSFLAIHGDRRTGKTTLLRLAAGIEVADEGVVRVCGHDLACLSAAGRARLRRSEIGFVPGVYSVDGAVAASSRCESVAEHVSLPLVGAGQSPTDAHLAADRVLYRLDASAYADAPLQELTPPERARVALARALARAPRLLLVDDPAPTQDPQDREEIAAVLGDLGRDPALTLVVASTDADMLRGASVTATLADGVLHQATDGTLLPFPRRAPEGSLVP